MSGASPHDRRGADDGRPVQAGGGGRAAPEESWFGALGVDGDTAFRDDLDVGAHGAPFPPRRPAPAEAHTRAQSEAHARAQSREALRVAKEAEDTALRRVFRTYVAARAALGAALAMVPWLTLTMGVKPALATALVCLAYMVQAVVVWQWPRLSGAGAEASIQQLGRPHWLATIGADLLAFGTLHVLEGGTTFNYAALLVLPVLMAGLLTRRLRALATTSVAALLLLGTGLWRAGTLVGADAASLLTQAGLAGLGLFFVVLLGGEVSWRLRREEMAARGSLEIARQQAQLNRLVIEEMVEGVLVVDRRHRVRAANPAARTLLAAHGEQIRPAPFQLHDVPAWQPLQHAVARAFLDGTWPSDTHELTLGFEGGDRRTLQVRGRFTRRRGTDSGSLPPEEFCVLFLEDLRSVQARMRQDKLAAMGRVSAGIAHEIRNPLAAIAQANALMLEDAGDPGARRLATIVADNVERLKRIVDDVLEVTPGPAVDLHAIDATALVGRTCADWARTVQLPLGPGSRLQVSLPAQPLGVVFDPEHLRRVLVNLLDNARRHAGDGAGAIELHLVALDGDDALLSVASDGPPIPPEVERHLFEPFFSTRSRGTGLGLYICRELCERYGASIDFRPHPSGDRHRNEFTVTMRRAELPDAPMNDLIHP